MDIATQSSTEVCLICSNYSDKYCHVYILDIKSQDNNGDDDGFIPRAPTIILEGFNSIDDAFCVVNSTLYIFQGRNDRSLSDQDDDDAAAAKQIEEARNRKSVFTVDLSPDISANFNLKLNKSMMGKAPDMIVPKRHPTAVPSPDHSKILVFSPYCRYDEEIELELYDTKTKSWRQLPKLNNTLSIEAYSFVSKHVFLVHTKTNLNLESSSYSSSYTQQCGKRKYIDKSRVLSLDLESSSSTQQRWKKKYFNTFRGVGNVGEFFVVGDGICVTTFRVYDEGRLESKEWFYLDHWPLLHSSFLEQEQSEAIALVNNDDRRCSFCCILGRSNRNTGHPHLVINEYAAEIGKYRDDKLGMGHSAQLITKKVKTFRFLLNTLSHCHHGSFTICGFQTITRVGD